MCVVVFSVAAVAVAATAAERVPNPTRARDAEPCAWLVFIDDLHLDFPATGRLKNLLKTVFSEFVQEGDFVSVVSTGPSSIAIDLTRDRGRLAGVFNKVSGAGLKPSEIVDGGPYGDSSEVRYRAHFALRTAYDAMKMLIGVRWPRQAFIYISNGYYFDVWAGAMRMGSVNPFTRPRKQFEGGADRPSSISLEHLRDEVAELTTQASHANVSIYAIDPRALAGPLQVDPKLDDVTWLRYLTTTRNSLRVVAEQTGGFLVEDELESGLRRIAAAKGR